MSRWNLGWLAGISAMALLSLSVLTFTAPARDGNLQRKHENLKLLVDVLEEVQGRYVKPLDDKKMRELVEHMINGGLEKLDPHSGFISADDFRQFQHQSKGKFGGVGIRIGLDKFGNFLVESPIPGTPAYDAGVMAGDLILKVDGKSLEHKSLRDVVDLIQGEPGSDVTLTVLHEAAKKTVDLPMKRAEIKIESVMGDQRQKDNLKEWDFWVDPLTKIAYVRVVAFTETTVEELTKTVDALQKAGMRGLVLDLRSNPGGLLKSAVDVASLFMPEGKNVVSTKGRGGSTEEVYKSQQKNPDVKAGTFYPIAILLNRYSASAAEIVAAALQDHARAVIIGERSYGKGSVQNLIPMEGGTSALKITTASYWRPSGRNIHRFPDSKEEDEWGVKPDKDYEVKMTDEERVEFFKFRRERDIVRRAGEPVKPAPESKEEGDKTAAKKKEPFRDRVLDKALEYVRTQLALQSRQQPDRGAQAPAIEPAAPAADVRRAPTNVLAERRERVMR